MATDHGGLATGSYTATITATVSALMRDRGMNPTSLSRGSGVPRGAIDDALFRGKPWKTSHLEAIAKTLNTELTVIVSPGARLKEPA